MTLPISIRTKGAPSGKEKRGYTKDVSFKGLYFFTEAQYEMGARIEFVLTLPKEVTQVGDVNIRCFGEVVRIEPKDGNHGIAARIERYEFLPGAA